MSQPDHTIMQIAYVVDDVESAAQRCSELTGAGPFFLLENLEVIEPRYRGEATDIDVTIALGYSGAVCVEFIQQMNDVPSVYRELIDRSGGGFHHWGVMTESFDDDVAGYEARGHALAFSGTVAVGARFAYMDTVAALGGMLELIEVTPAVRELFAGMEQAAAGWDGNDPVRRP